MDWVAWLVPAIAVIVWILSSLARNAEVKKAPPAGPAPRRTAEIDRFLEEINQRRRQQGKEPAAPPPPPPKPKPAPPRARPRQAARPAAAASVPIAIAVVEEAIPVALAADQLPGTLESRIAPPTAPPLRPAVRRGPSPLLVELLKSREGIAAAFLLREILGPPRAVQPPRRPGVYS